MRKLFIFLLFPVFLSGCSPMIDSLGTAPTAQQLGQLHIGKTSYADVQTLLGSPSSKTVFGHEYWLYVSSRQERFAFFKPEETDRTVTVLRFDDNGVLQGIDVKDFTDAKAIVYDSEKTPIAGHSVSVTDQLLNNIGRFEQKTR